MQMFFDGWYAQREDAEACLAHCERRGAIRVGLVESKQATWGLLYFASSPLFVNHVLDKDNAIFAALRPLRDGKWLELSL